MIYYLILLSPGSWIITCLFVRSDMMGSKFKLALIQLSVGSNKLDNLARAVSKISEAVERGADVVSLPGIT